MQRILRSAVIATSLLVAPFVARGQVVGRNDASYVWHGALPAQARLSVKNFNGAIEVRQGSGADAEIRAEKRARGGAALSDVGFHVETASTGDVTFCSVLRNHDSCDSRGWNSDDDDWRGELSVALTITVPRGAHLALSTGNGTVTVDRVAGEVRANTGNGRVRVTGTDGDVQVNTGNGDVEVTDAKGPVRVRTGNGRVQVNTAAGPVDARSGNGDIDVAMTTVRARDDMTFSTGSGRVRVTLPSAYSGELDASTGSGEIESDFDLKLRGSMSTRHVRATIGEGGPTLRLTSGNGRLELRKSR